MRTSTTLLGIVCTGVSTLQLLNRATDTAVKARSDVREEWEKVITAAKIDVGI